MTHDPKNNLISCVPFHLLSWLELTLFLGKYSCIRKPQELPIYNSDGEIIPIPVSNPAGCRSPKYKTQLQKTRKIRHCRFTNLFNANKAHITPAVSDSPKTFGRRKWELEVLFVTTTVTMEWLSECSTTIIIGL